MFVYPTLLIYYTFIQSLRYLFFFISYIIAHWNGFSPSCFAICVAATSNQQIQQTLHQDKLFANISYLVMVARTHLAFPVGKNPLNMTGQTTANSTRTYIIWISYMSYILILSIGFESKNRKRIKCFFFAHRSLSSSKLLHLHIYIYTYILWWFSF